MIQFFMNDLYNELIGFALVSAVVFMLAYLTKKKQEQFLKNEEKKDV
ncbi:MAG: hypothetical protein HRT41_15035 [Campylobacteraceae bacterium]|nr:hypothetical protein [Campylobacteraceae bacterium]